MLSEEAFASMKDSAVFINVGRGAVVDEKVMIKHLARIRGAALDVFEEEPLPESSPLWDMDNVIVSPHCSDNLVEYGHEYDSVDYFLENLKEFQRSGKVLYEVNKELGY